MKGSNGGWKDFLAVYDKNGVSLSDLARRSEEALIGFLNTFTNADDLKFFEKVLENHESLEHIKKKSDKLSPEQELVYKTIAHPQYSLTYSFPVHEEGWLVTKSRKKNKATRSNTMVAVDCEMVLCEDGTEALVRVCVVDHDLQVKLDELVKPEKMVTDYRTHITGVAAKDLENVTCSLQDVQISMMKLLSRGTILVGHSLNNDLQALKIEHTRIIDTSLIFKFWSGSNIRRPSLNDLCKASFECSNLVDAIPLLYCFIENLTYMSDIPLYLLTFKPIKVVLCWKICQKTYRFDPVVIVNELVLVQ